jgi:hypothetical protein
VGRGVGGNVELEPFPLAKVLPESGDDDVAGCDELLADNRLRKK